MLSFDQVEIIAIVIFQNQLCLNNVTGDEMSGLIKFLYWNSLQYCMFLLSCLVLYGLLPKREINILLRVSTIIAYYNGKKVAVNQNTTNNQLLKCLITLKSIFRK